MGNETHPYNLRESIPENTRLLIIGTAPPPRFSIPKSAERGGLEPKDFDFYYGSFNNEMWRILNNIAKQIDGEIIMTDDTPSERCCVLARSFLQRHAIWMHDVLETYTRKEGKERSAGDSDFIEPHSDEFTDFRLIFARNKSLKAVAFTSELATEWAFRAMTGQGLISQQTYLTALSHWRNIKGDFESEDYIAQKFEKPVLRNSIDQQEIAFYTLPSPSGSSRRKGLTVDIRQKIYKSVLFGKAPSVE